MIASQFTLSAVSAGLEICVAFGSSLEPEPEPNQPEPTPSWEETEPFRDGGKYEWMDDAVVENLIAEMKASLGITFVVISHDIVGTFRIADRLGMLYKGRLIAWGTPDEVMHSPDPVVRQFLGRNLQLPSLATAPAAPESN